MAQRSELIEETLYSPSGALHLRAEVVYERLPVRGDADEVTRYRVLVAGVPVGEVWRVEFARRQRAKFTVRSVWRCRTANGTSSLVPRRSRREATGDLLVFAGFARPDLASVAAIGQSGDLGVRRTTTVPTPGV